MLYGVSGELVVLVGFMFWFKGFVEKSVKEVFDVWFEICGFFSDLEDDKLIK